MNLYRTSRRRLLVSGLAMAAGSLISGHPSEAWAQPAPAITQVDTSANARAKAQAQAQAQAHPALQASCLITFGQANVDYGSFTAGQLSRDANHRYTLPSRSVALSISCPAPQPMSLRLNAAARPDGAVRFAQGGAMTVVLSQVRIDGQDTRVINPDTHHGPQSQAALRPGEIVVMEHGRSGRTLTAQIDLYPEVFDADVRVTDQTLWSTTLLVELLDTDRAR